jgi:two-component system response regulator YesN
MIRVYIVDDELLIREGIKKIIRENCPDCEVIGEAANGKAALEDAIKLRPDIAIVDICMPIMGGLEFVNSVLGKLPKIKFIMISGYADFKYARDSLALGCSSYLLKPIKHDELINAITKLGREIKADISRFQTELEISAKIKELIGLQRNDFLRKLLDGKLKSIDHDKLDILDLGHLRNGFYLAVLNIDNFYALNIINSSDHDPAGSLINNISGIALNVMNWNRGLKGFTVETGEREVTILIGFPSGKRSFEESRIGDVMKNIQAIIRRNLQISTTIGYSLLGVTVATAADAYEMAKCAVQQRFMRGPGNTFKYSKTMNNEPYVYPFAAENRLILGIELKNDQEILGGLNMIISTFGQGNVSRNLCLELLGGMYLKVKQKLLHLHADEMLQIIPEYSNFKNRLSNIDTFNELKIYLLDLFNKIADGLKSLTTDSKRKIVKLALEYLDQNYHNNIGLYEVADYIGMNPSYFSVLFKKQMGETFTDYIIKFRVEKAKLYLAQSNHKVHKVAELVGYGDTKHFSKIFKRVVGLTPGEYREMNSANRSCKDMPMGRVR